MTALDIDARSAQATILNNSGVGNNNMLGKKDRGGVIQAIPFYYKNESGVALSADSIIELCVVGPGTIFGISYLNNSALGVGRTLDIGLQEYTSTDGTVNTPQIDVLVNGAAVENAATTLFMDLVSGAAGEGLTVDGQAKVLAKIIGDTFPTNGIIQGVIFLLQT